MSELSPHAKQLFEAAREAYSPTEASLNAVRTALDARLVAEAAAAASGAAGVATKAAIATKLTWISLATVAAVGTTVWVTREPTPAKAPSASTATATIAQGPAPGAPNTVRPPAVAASVAEPAGAGTPELARVTTGSSSAPSVTPARSSANAIDMPAASAGAQPKVLARDSGRARARGAVRSSPRASPRAATPSVDEQAEREELPAAPEPARAAPQRDGLESEVALISAARLALERGDPAEALSLVDAHAARHARGVLAQERLATRVLALCALERTDDARSAARALERLAPRSPHLSRVRASCAAE